MFERRLLAKQSVAIVLMFASFACAQADDVNKYIADPRVNLEMADGADTSATNRATTADVAAEQPDVIEEIVVFGRKKRKSPTPDSSLSVDPFAPKPVHIDWEILPTYDPEQAYPYLGQLQFGEEIRRTGSIELFRIRFGG